MKTYGIKRIKFETIENENGTFSYVYKYENMLDMHISDTEQQAKTYMTELKKDIAKNWKALRQAFKNKTMYYGTYTNVDGSTYAIVSDFKTNRTDCRYIRENTPEVTKLELVECYKYVKGL